MGNLLRLVRHSTEQAIQRQMYLTEGWGASETVDLGRWLSPSVDVSWIGRANVDAHQGALDAQPKPNEIAPPLLMCDDQPLDVAVTVARMVEPGRPILLVLELCDFDDSGGLALERLSGASAQGLCLRSDFVRFARKAEARMAGSQASVRSHMRAQSDPFVFMCRDVAVFRGARAQGFPLLAEPLNIHVIAVAMPNMRPAAHMVDDVTGKARSAEWYKDEADHAALVERLNLLGLVALQDCASDAAGTPPPILVLGSPGCAGLGPHPRDAVAQSLKHWRRRFSPFFHSVFVCTGGRGNMGCELPLASHLDDIVNHQVHKIAENEMLARSAMPWHWDMVLIRMCACSQKLERVASRVEKLQRGAPPEQPRWPAAQGSSTGASDGVAGLRRRSCRVSVVDSIAHSMRCEIAAEKGRTQWGDDEPASPTWGAVGGAGGGPAVRPGSVAASAGSPAGAGARSARRPSTVDARALAAGPSGKRASVVGLPCVSGGPRASVVGMPGQGVSRKSVQVSPTDGVGRDSSTVAQLQRHSRDHAPRHVMAPISERGATFGLTLGPPVHLGAVAPEPTSATAEECADHAAGPASGSGEAEAADEEGPNRSSSDGFASGSNEQAGLSPRPESGFGDDDDEEDAAGTVEDVPSVTLRTGRRMSSSGGRGLSARRRSSLPDCAAFVELAKIKDDHAIHQRIRRKSMQYDEGGDERLVTAGRQAEAELKQGSLEAPAAEPPYRRKSWLADTNPRTDMELRIREEARQRLMTRRASQDPYSDSPPAGPRRLSGGLVSFYGTAPPGQAGQVGGGGGPQQGEARAAGATAAAAVSAPEATSPGTRFPPRKVRPALGRKAASRKSALEETATHAVAVNDVMQELQGLASRFEELTFKGKK